MCGQGAESHAEGELEPSLRVLVLASALMCRHCELLARPPICTLRWPGQEQS